MSEQGVQGEPTVLEAVLTYCAVAAMGLCLVWLVCAWIDTDKDGVLPVAVPAPAQLDKVPAAVDTDTDTDREGDVPGPVML